MIVFQPKGKEHIKYIKKIAQDMWSDNDYKIFYVDCLNTVLRKHREYIASGTEVLPLKTAPTLLINKNTTWQMNDDDDWEPVVNRS